jgi:predicted nucleic acid-binding protein
MKAGPRDSSDCVVDASVGIKLFLVEPLSDRADALFAHLIDDPPSRFYVPDLFFIECTNILWKYVQRFGYSADAARQNVVDLTSLPLQIVSTVALAEAALNLSMEHSSTAYDSAYIALAQQLSLPLVTADEALVRHLGNIDLDVRFLGDWPE